MKFLIAILFFFADFALFAVPNYPPTYYIPAGGQTINNLTYYQVAGQTFYVTTSGAVNLGSNTYTLTYASLPNANTTWNVIFDATNLTLATKTNVNLFGETPLATYNGIKKFYINFSVVWDAATPTKKVTYFSSLDDLKNFASSVNFNARANFNDTVKFYGKTYVAPTSAISVGNSAIAIDTSGQLGWGCTPWCVTGNSGLTNVNFLGNTDTVGLNFRVNNQPSGRIDYPMGNTYLGYTAGLLNTTGVGNTAIGSQSLYHNTTGVDVTAVGLFSLYQNTTGQENTAVGYDAITQGTTGSKNSGFGSGSLFTVTTGSNNTALGNSADVATSSTHDAISIGYNSISGTSGIAIGTSASASANQLAIAGIRSISIPDMTSAVNYVLTDTSGTGDFVPRSNPIFAETNFTPLTGDSIQITTSQNVINPAGTLAVLTVILPADPYSGQIVELTTTQVLTSVLWSVRVSGGTSAGLPSTLAQYGTAKVKWNATLSMWLNW